VQFYVTTAKTFILTEFGFRRRIVKHLEAGSPTGTPFESGIHTMRKSVWLLALLFTVGAATLANADNTGVNFNYNGGTLSATETITKGQVTSVSIDGFTLNVIEGQSNSLLEGCAKGGCSWSLFEAGGDIILEVVSGNTYELAGCSHCTRDGYGTIKSGATFGPTAAMPEPPVYLLALLGIVFTRNRISQGLRQALRWNR
jgi:hypothetical protein